MKRASRSVGRDRPGAVLVAASAALAASLGVLAPRGDASPRSGPIEGSGPLRIGMNSCAARGCHGAVDSTDPARGQVYIAGGAYTTWLRDDPHARGFATLLEPRSVAIAARLKGPLGGKPAHESATCLACHSTVGPAGSKDPASTPLRDGITCESCHGPAEIWQEKHLSTAWRGRPASAKALDGLADLASPSGRAKACVACHVGDRSRGMDVNHDLVAAGHPRLNFEFASYLAAYPKHWREPHERSAAAGGGPVDFEAKSWAVGQVVVARAVLELLTARALESKEGASKHPSSPEAVWPEFSEYECFACHHDLINPSPRQSSKAALGRVAWQTWPFAMLPDLAKGSPGQVLDAVGRVRAEMVRSSPDPDAVVGLARDGVKPLDELIRAIEAGPIEPARVEAWRKEMGSRTLDVAESWDRAAQRFLALEAMARASKAMGLAIDPGTESASLVESKALDFPSSFDSPRVVSPRPSRP